MARKSDWYDPKQRTCSTCKGTGYDPSGAMWTDKQGREHVHTCPQCRGSGNA